MVAAMQAHVAEHVAFEYRKQIEKQLGVPLPKMDEDMPEEIEIEVSRMMAAASEKLLQKDQAEAAAQQAQQAQEDPIVKIQMQELELKKQEVEIKKTKLQIDAANAADRLELEKDRIESQKEIAGMQVGARAAKDRQEFQGKMELEGIKIGSQIAKDQNLPSK
jgi:hypothetical protein